MLSVTGPTKSLKIPETIVVMVVVTVMNYRGSDLLTPTTNPR